MRISIIHLSDIHFQAASNALRSRLEKLVAAIRPMLNTSEAAIIAVTGDISFSGEEEEYRVAFEFFSGVKTLLDGFYPEMPIEFVFIPGNHDCNFRDEGDARPALLQTLPGKIDDLDPAGEIVTRISDVQGNFFSFQGRFNGLGAKAGPERLRYQSKVQLGQASIVLDCYNTAWMSQKQEQQGSLLYPLRLLTLSSHEEEVDQVTISLLHHRDNWLEANNARVLRDFIEGHSDIILSGHEHVGTAYLKRKLDGTGAQYVEGAVLQDPSNPNNSGFNVLELDLKDELQRITQFRWVGGRYSSEAEHGWTRVERNTAALRRGFQIAPAFLKILRDPGTGFTHPAKADLMLDDFFVYPDLRRRSLGKLVNPDSPPLNVQGEDVVKFVADSKRMLITGPDDSGRTALARMLYMDLRRREKLIPILLDAKEIRGRKPDLALGREVDRAVSAQYLGTTAEAYRQMDPARKVLIIDDWHKLNYNLKGQASLLQSAEKAFGRVVCMADDIFVVEQLTGGEEKPFGEYESCEIKELGHLRRAELIRKWHLLGFDYTEGEADMAHAVATIEATVNTLLGKNLLPAFPVIILAILQSYAANRTPNSSAGSYGQMYEALITAALASVSRKAVELGTKYTYTSHIAHYIFDTNRYELDESDLRKIHDEYVQQYKMSVDLKEMTEQLLEAQILSRTNGLVRFRYKYIYCYFVAKYFQDSIANLVGEGDLRRKLHDIADKVYLEDYVNIIIFYVYLTKDRELIEYLLANANRVYREFEPCDLTSHVEFVNRLGTDFPELVLPPTDVESNRTETLRRRDAAEEEIEKTEEKGSQAIKYDDALADFVKIHIALKNLRILGQILRNFPGALRADLKLDLAFASYQLGLRTLRAIFHIAENNIDDLRVYIARLIQERRALEDHEKLTEKTDRVVISLTRNVAFGMMKRISYAVGLEELEETYKAIIDRDGGKLPVRAIDYTIKLDHFTRFPKPELERMLEETRNNPFTLRLVRDLTAEYLYLFPADYRIRQFISDKLKIRVNTAQVLGAGGKKMKSLPAKATIK